MHRLLLSPLLLLALATTSVAENWPSWRGPAGTGVSTDKNFPVEWSSTKNIKWKTPLADPGNSTPIVWGDKVFLTSSKNDGTVRTVTCFDRGNGKVLWTKSISAAAGELTHKTNPIGASSPTTDGERVYAWHGSAGIVAYDMKGNQIWHKNLGEFKHIWGYASSPVLVDDLVIVSCGPGLNAFLIGLDKKTGEQAWKRPLPDAQSKTVKEFKGSWSTPVLRKTAEGKELVLSLPDYVMGFDPKTGETNWKCRGLSKLTYTSPLIAGDVVVAMSGYHGPALACRVRGRGDITDNGRLWLHSKKNPQRVGSGIIADGHIYILNEPGITWCIELATGEIKWQKRIGGRSWSSMNYVDGKLYVINMKGETLVLRPNPEKCEVVTKNALADETTRASLAFSDGQIFIRSYGHLYCIERSE